ncbi:hypothetical protein COU57_05995 [Candidatus Pacearchaeota archaeon CG10_big_fil_rev_8_21_14_0_10_32_14]|nr:MAG: hypothetical protein COU57_05995 [Candidatus Pacearchaeota archaeon CG10_big_fil_rev_8_21_14_0_10_32_14]
MEKLKYSDLTLINPRRKDYDFNDPNIETQQVEWGFEHLHKARGVSFRFPPQTLCPITLYELGKISVGNKPLFIRVHPDYKRKRDIEIQTGLIRPDVKIVHSLDDLVEQIREWGQ